MICSKSLEVAHRRFDIAFCQIRFLMPRFKPLLQLAIEIASGVPDFSIFQKDFTRISVAKILQSHIFS